MIQSTQGMVLLLFRIFPMFFRIIRFKVRFVLYSLPFLRDRNRPLNLNLLFLLRFRKRASIRTKILAV